VWGSDVIAGEQAPKCVGSLLRLAWCHPIICLRRASSLTVPIIHEPSIEPYRTTKRRAVPGGSSMGLWGMDQA
jgi:hypothetical protein